MTHLRAVDDTGTEVRIDEDGATVLSTPAGRAHLERLRSMRDHPCNGQVDPLGPARGALLGTALGAGVLAALVGIVLKVIAR